MKDKNQKVNMILFCKLKTLIIEISNIIIETNKDIFNYSIQTSFLKSKYIINL